MDIKVFINGGQCYVFNNVKDVWVKGKIELYDQFHNGIDGTDWEDISIEDGEVKDEDK